MDNITLNQKLYNRAMQLGMCKRIADIWKDTDDKSTLVKRYKNDINFCIQNDFPNIEFIKANFPHDMLVSNGIFIDEHIDMEASSGTYVFNGASHGVIRFRSRSIANVYIRHKSDIHIDCSGNSKVFVTLLDDAHLFVSQSGNAKPYIYKKGGTLSYVGDAFVR